MITFILFSFSDFLKTKIGARQRELKNIALLSSKKKKCIENKQIYITNAYGRTGNDWITIGNGLWLASQVHGYFSVPQWAQKRIFNQFNLDVFYKTFCIRPFLKESNNQSFETIQLTGGTAYFLFRRYNESFLVPHLPPLTRETYQSLLHVHKMLHASLWSNPNPKLFDTAIHIIKDLYGNRLDYVSIHQRSHEGNCPNLFCDHTNISLFSKYDIPLYEKEWTQRQAWEELSNSQSQPRNCTGDIPRHPMCDISASAVSNILSMHKGRNWRDLNISIHLGTDRRVGVNDIVTKLKAIIPQQVVSHNKHSMTLNADFVFLDLFLFIHSGLFIQNPMSTLSTTACIVRNMLGLRTVPVLNTTHMSVENRFKYSFCIPQFEKEKL